ncbi:MAG: enoyl-CoA hydratase/isomerase family protein [Rhodospirillaceae bacterium]|nr:enoyl-CoA hydratase/isomerase family protein [Rhodospirillaceae bacterium]MYB15367.1 enoyl-CoA hydratase/isomerase family protein [Rhodospirillaceae bacterium]MYI47849.1 enoyl-CoA hydratase/isomerase family protein [Rhodospirillaceae bacterium]
MDEDRSRTVLTEIDGRGVARITLNRPEVRNAMNAAFIRDLTEAVEAVGADEAVRAVILTGQGKGFCAGADLAWMRETAGYSVEENYADSGRLGRMLNLMNTLPRPVIGLINGHAFGGGVGLVACCDIAIASSAAKFSLSEVRLGLTPATIGPYVVRRIGQSHARRYFLTAEVFDAARAEEIGLVHTVAEPDGLEAAGQAFVDLLLLGGPKSQAVSKDLIFRVSDREIDDGLIDWTSRLIADIRASGEGREGAGAFLEKRKPAWQVRD